MADYISRDDVLKAIDYQHEVNNVFESEAAYVQMWETINDDMGIKSADVQPVEKWCEYGFEYREPAEYGYYLTYYHGRIHVSEWSVSGWYNETGLPIDDDVVKYWQPLPEPPVTD